MKGIYIYPITSRNQSGTSNPYINNLIGALKGSFRILNAHHPSDKGILDLFKYLRKTDFILLNWIENLPARHLGGVQSFLFFLACGYCRLTGIKIVWTMHNKKSHSKKNNFLKKRLYRYMIRRSDLIITHAKEGLSVIPRRKLKIYEPHPVVDSEILEKVPNRFDIIIWGSIAKYKGIHNFLKFLEESDKIVDFKILIAGKIMEPELEQTLERFNERYENLTLFNKFIPREELNLLIMQSSVILFTYNAESILSSGALMDSLAFPVTIMGPHSGAFRDLEEEKLIYTFTDLGNLVSHLERLRSIEFNDFGSLSRRKQFMKEHTWDKFGEVVTKTLLNLN